MHIPRQVAQGDSDLIRTANRELLGQYFGGVGLGVRFDRNTQQGPKAASETAARADDTALETTFLTCETGWTPDMKAA